MYHLCSTRMHRQLCFNSLLYRLAVCDITRIRWQPLYPESQPIYEQHLSYLVLRPQLYCYDLLQVQYIARHQLLEVLLRNLIPTLMSNDLFLGLHPAISFFKFHQRFSVSLKSGGCDTLESSRTSKAKVCWKLRVFVLLEGSLTQKLQLPH